MNRLTAQHELDIHKAIKDKITVESILVKCKIMRSENKLTNIVEQQLHEIICDLEKLNRKE